MCSLVCSPSPVRIANSPHQRREYISVAKRRKTRQFLALVLVILLNQFACESARPMAGVGFGGRKLPPAPLASCRCGEEPAALTRVVCRHLRRQVDVGLCGGAPLSRSASVRRYWRRLSIRRRRGGNLKFVCILCGVMPWVYRSSRIDDRSSAPSSEGPTSTASRATLASRSHLQLGRRHPPTRRCGRGPGW
jgi:hypothetical protein